MIIPSARTRFIYIHVETLSIMSKTVQCVYFAIVAIDVIIRLDNASDVVIK